jgi:predicted Zn-dependent peptidase
MPGLRTLALTVAVRGGARWEDETRSGWSHCLEHLVFKGAGSMGAREIVERIEAQGGSINAATGYERTSFEIRGLQGTLALSMQVLSDLIFRPILDPTEIEREKDVVAQEIAESFDTPDDHVFEMAQARAFADQPIGRPIRGSVESLAPLGREAIGDWRARLYSPDRMVVAAAGAVDETELLTLAERWFGPETPTSAPPPDAARFTGGAASLTRRIEQANLVFQLPSASVVDPGYPAARILAEILGGGMASRLFQSAREERGLAYAIDAYHEPYEDVGVLGIYAGASADRAVELAGVCAHELRALADEGPTPAEVARAQAVLNAGLWMAEENPAARAGRAAAQTLIFGRPLDSARTAERTLVQIPATVQAAAAAALSARVAACAVLGPRAAAPAGAAFQSALFS